MRNFIKTFAESFFNFPFFLLFPMVSFSDSAYAKRNLKNNNNLISKFVFDFI